MFLNRHGFSTFLKNPMFFGLNDSIQIQYVRSDFEALILSEKIEAKEDSLVTWIGMNIADLRFEGQTLKEITIRATRKNSDLPTYTHRIGIDFYKELTQSSYSDVIKFLLHQDIVAFRVFFPSLAVSTPIILFPNSFIEMRFDIDEPHSFTRFTYSRVGFDKTDGTWRILAPISKVVEPPAQ